MSSRETKLLGRFGLVALLSLALAGCFRPVYGPAATPGVMSKGASADVAELMRSVDVKPIEGRVGGKMRNELIFLLRGGGAAGATTYRLTVNLARYGQSAVVDPVANSVDTRTISMTADYTLTRSGSLDPIATGNAYATATFFASLQRFANVRAERDAEDRAATQIAERIRSRLQAYFATGQ